MKKIILIAALVIPLCISAKSAKSPQFPWDSLRHEVRVGWGDPMFESAMMYEFPRIGKPNTDVSYLPGHFFAEYQYYWFPWLSSGLILDYTGMGWMDKRDPNHTNHCYYDISILPTVRFTYYRHPWVKLYSAVMVGMTINGGTEIDPVRSDQLGREVKTVCYPGLGITALGMQVGQKGFYGAVEIGGLSALLGFKDVALLSSRMLTVSVGYKFNAPQPKARKEAKL